MSLSSSSLVQIGTDAILHLLHRAGEVGGPAGPYIAEGADFVKEGVLYIQEQNPTVVSALFLASVAGVATLVCTACARRSKGGRKSAKKQKKKPAVTQKKKPEKVTEPEQPKSAEKAKKAQPEQAKPAKAAPKVNIAAAISEPAPKAAAKTATPTKAAPAPKTAEPTPPPQTEGTKSRSRKARKDKGAAARSTEGEGEKGRDISDETAQDRAYAEALQAVENNSPSLSPVGSPPRRISGEDEWETVKRKRKVKKEDTVAALTE